MIIKQVDNEEEQNIIKNGTKNKRRISDCFENDRANQQIINNSKRLFQDEEVGRSKGGSRNVAATKILQGYESANREKQQYVLTEWAKENNYWFMWEEIKNEFGMFLSEKTSEAKVFMYDEGYVLKVTKVKRPLEFLDNRIALHNYLFPGTIYELLGFCNRYDGKFCSVLIQPFIEGIKPTHDEIYNEMVNKRGFTKKSNPDLKATYYNNDYIISDLYTDNFIKDINGDLFCIDPRIKLNPKNRSYNNI